MGDTDVSTASLIDNDAFISDMARFADGTGLSEKQLRKKYRFDETTWEQLGSDDLLCERIEAEKARRIANGSTARQRAQVHFATAPNVLGGILNDNNANARHRIESAKELRAIATPASEAAAASERFQITIILSADGNEHVEKYDKPLKPIEPTIDPDAADTAPQKLIEDSDGQNNL
jgi:hypothetical protein